MILLTWTWTGSRLIKFCGSGYYQSGSTSLQKWNQNDYMFCKPFIIPKTVWNGVSKTELVIFHSSTYTSKVGFLWNWNEVGIGEPFLFIPFSEFEVDHYSTYRSLRSHLCGPVQNYVPVITTVLCPKERIFIMTMFCILIW